VPDVICDRRDHLFARIGLESECPLDGCKLRALLTRLRFSRARGIARPSGCAPA
jgi:hypothetical protein